MATYEKPAKANYNRSDTAAMTVGDVEVGDELYELVTLAVNKPGEPLMLYPLAHVCLITVAEIEPTVLPGSNYRCPDMVRTAPDEQGMCSFALMRDLYKTEQEAWDSIKTRFRPSKDYDGYYWEPVETSE